MSLKADVGIFVWKKNNWEMPWKMLFINDNEKRLWKMPFKSAIKMISEQYSREPTLLQSVVRKCHYKPMLQN